MKTLLSLILFFNVSFALVVEGDSTTNLSYSNFTEQNFTANEKDIQVNSDKKLELSIYSFYKQSDFVTKIIIYILVIFSILTWSVLIGKTIHYYVVFHILNKDREIVSKIVNLNKNINFHKNSFVKILIEEIKDETNKSKNYSKDTIDRIRYRIESNNLSFLANCKSYTPILATIGSSATFLGLFGTVWGIMNSFIAIASISNPNLSVVAPGIAQALFTTALGLGVAIPAVLFYNYLSRRSVKFANELSKISTTLFVIAHRNLNKENYDKS
ncbi:TonB system transport protein ExbB [Campylobacter blaseri]|uniref:Biopolymer transporter ExbB n=1 Tax=Campylobacter blaseri TaxID=2042961 RepID=A0A2P8R434_9BACT|nr:MotA/TolQ/ExbB proton channel family protein [Campylobacter blaseri]PSM53229.1 biopolymer transporter ExbB [Campylobacter blaseri]PSM54695.1 biopolymer transporter ExbB [Campylobacter blaseri]QKF86822.1 TonB system transport protein ExbB [Campylobacter blaseri]